MSPESLVCAELPSRALIAVSGPDWRGFLHNLLTQDVETVADGEARFGGLLTPQGRLLYDLFVVGRGEGALLDVAAEHRDALLQRLLLYRLRAKVEIIPSAHRVLALFNPLPVAARGRGGGVGAAPADPGASPPLPTIFPQGGEGFVRDPRLPELGWRGYGVAVDRPLENETAYDAHRLVLGVPGPADWGSDKTYPIEANFDLLNGIDFHKGCFVGQETTSRMKRRGTVKNRMLPIVFEGEAPAPGTEVLNGELRAGEVLSGREGRAMALLRLDRLDGDLTAGGKPVRAERPSWFPQALGDEAA